LTESTKSDVSSDAAAVARNIAMPKLVRLPDWEGRLSEFLYESQIMGVELDWEFHNCTSWVCDAIEVMTGVDIYSEYRGESTTSLGAFRMMVKHGFNNLNDIVASKLPEISPVYAQRGDLVMCKPIPLWDRARSGAGLEDQIVLTDAEVKPMEPRPCSIDYDGLGMPLAVCLADYPVVWCLNEHGLDKLDASDVVRAFQVGER
jgi:hypothetical protein